MRDIDIILALIQCMHIHIKNVISAEILYTLYTLIVLTNMFVESPTV